VGGADIHVTLLDECKTVDYWLRPIYYATLAAKNFGKRGSPDDVAERGLKPEGVCWRRFNRKWLTGIGRSVI